ncbi:MAG TPA: long-chain fatty acid--CoA ligase [Spirochaetota bacterium]|nr:long-chain fatty acid--CoA ligase [Spirochaetota bacterium]HPS87733.1 long-chain fatty acid--CoA ligase [Spirochaetota bacterium]
MKSKVFRSNKHLYSEKPWLKDFDEDVVKWHDKWIQSYDKIDFAYPEYPDVPLKDLFNKWTAEKPDKDYIIYNDTRLDYKTVNMLARKLANALMSLGIKKGDRVAVMAPNIPQYIIAIHALLKFGGIEVPANVLYTVPELKLQFNDSGSETVIVLAPFADKAIKIMREKGNAVKRVIVIQIPGMPIEIEKAPDIFDFNAIIGAASDKEPDVAVYPSDIQKLQYTGGTTGIPKGCVITNAMNMTQIVRTAEWLGTAAPLDDFRSLCAIPLNHIYGYNANVNIALYRGGTIILVAQPTPDNLLEAINKHEPNLWAAVPAMLIGLISHPEIGKSKIKSIKGIFCGSAPLAVGTLEKFEELSGGRVVEGAGMSETVNIYTVNPVGKRKFGSCGIIWPDTDLVVVDVETGRKVMGRGEEGELIGRGPQFTAQYWKNPEETANTIRDGWLYTGDIVKIDEEGFVFILDRKKDMVIVNGFNVYPRDIDEVLYKHPKVNEVCTIGVQDDKQGESVKVFISVREGETMTADEVTAYCREQLAPYKVPRYIEFIEAIPRTPVGKPDRKVLKDKENLKRQNLNK